MNLPPQTTGRSPEEIITKDSYFESAGYLYRAVSWLDHFERESKPPALMYACIEGRYAIEYILFEELVLASGAKLSRTDYERCVREPTKLAKAIARLTPDYEKLQSFTKAAVSLNPGAPNIIYWEPNKLMKGWGQLSQYLHWVGHRLETTEEDKWKREALVNVKAVLLPIWEKMSSGPSGYLLPSEMHPEILEIWNDFKADRIDLEGATIRMNLIKPLVQSKYA